MKCIRCSQWFRKILFISLSLLSVTTGCNKEKKIEQDRYQGSHAGYIRAILNDSTTLTFDRLEMYFRENEDKFFISGTYYLDGSLTMVKLYVYGLKQNINKQYVFNTDYSLGKPWTIPRVHFYAHDDDIAFAQWTLDTTQENYLQFTEINEEKGILRGKFQLTASLSDKEERYQIPLPDQVTFTNGEFEILGAWKYSE